MEGEIHDGGTPQNKQEWVSVVVGAAQIRYGYWVRYGGEGEKGARKGLQWESVPKMNIA